MTSPLSSKSNFGYMPTTIWLHEISAFRSYVAMRSNTQEAALIVLALRHLLVISCLIEFALDQQ